MATQGIIRKKMPLYQMLAVIRFIKLTNCEVCFAQIIDDLFYMIGAACFDDRVNLGQLCGHVKKQALMINFDYIAATTAN